MEFFESADSCGCYVLNTCYEKIIAFCIFKLTIICSKDRIDTRELRFMAELSGNIHEKIGDLRIERGLKKSR